MHLALCSLRLLSGPRCLHHGRYGPEGPLYGEMPFSFSTVACVRLVLLFVYTSRCVSSLIGRPMMLSIMAGINQKDIFALFVDPCRDAEVFSHGPDCSSDHLLPQLLNTVADVLLCRSNRFSSPSWRRGRFHGLDCSSDH